MPDLSGEVAVAIIGAIGVLGAAAVGALGEAIRRNARATRNAVGELNGNGTVIDLCERILAGQAGQDKRIAKLEGGQHELRTDVARLSGRVDVLERYHPQQ